MAKFKGTVRLFVQVETRREGGGCEGCFEEEGGRKWEEAQEEEGEKVSWLVALRLEREDERLLDVSLTPSTRLSSSSFSNLTRLVSSDEDEDADDQRDRQHEPDSTKKKSKGASFEVEEDQHSGGRIDASTRHSFVHLSFRSTLETRAELLLFCFPTGQDRHRRSGRLALIESRLLGSFSFHTSSWPLASDDADRSSSLRSTSQGQTPSDRF